MSEHTVSVVSQNGQFYLIHQVNRDRHQCYRHQGQVVLPDNLASGKQPKRTQIADKIAEVFASDDTVADYVAGQYHKPAPDRSGLTGNQARCYMWTARRGIGGAVLPSGEQVGVYWANVQRLGFRYLEPGQQGKGGEVVEFDDVVDVQNPKPGGFRRELVGVRILGSKDGLTNEQLERFPIRVQGGGGVVFVSGNK